MKFGETTLIDGRKVILVAPEEDDIYVATCVYFKIRFNAKTHPVLRMTMVILLTQQSTPKKKLSRNSRG